MAAIGPRNVTTLTGNQSKSEVLRAFQALRCASLCARFSVFSSDPWMRASTEAIIDAN